jgi:hypothetical protein
MNLFAITDVRRWMKWNGPLVTSVAAGRSSRKNFADDVFDGDFLDVDIAHG